MTTLDEFLKSLDEINDFCEAIQDNEDCRDCCSDCVLKDCCLDIPVRSTFEVSIKATKEALDIIKRSKEEANNGKV